ncbi:MAG: hypothetical protein IJS61_07335 [Firmicutes bacterium]|nr:hypothetical protein [Bacillota bacterium]
MENENLFSQLEEKITELEKKTDQLQKLQALVTNMFLLNRSSKKKKKAKTGEDFVQLSIFD